MVMREMRLSLSWTSCWRLVQLVRDISKLISSQLLTVWKVRFTVLKLLDIAGKIYNAESCLKYLHVCWWTIGPLDAMRSKRGISKFLNEINNNLITRYTKMDTHRLRPSFWLLLYLSRRTEYQDSDGIVALILNVNINQFSSATQRQKFTDALNVILGNDINVRAYIELFKPLPDDKTEVSHLVVWNAYQCV